MPVQQRWFAGGLVGLVCAAVPVGAAAAGPSSGALAARLGTTGIVQVVARIGATGSGEAVCPGGDDVLGGGFAATDTDDGQRPVPVVMTPGDQGHHRGFFRVRLLDRAGHPWSGGGSVVAVCLPQPKARIGGLASRTASFQAGIGRAVCPPGDEATGGGFAVGPLPGSSAPPAPVSASTGTAEDGTSSYSVDLFTTAGAAFGGPARVTVRCLRASSALGSVAIVSGALSTSGQVSAVTCPAGEVALSGGYLSNYVAGQTDRPLPVVNRPGTPGPAGYAVALASDQGGSFPPGGFLEARCLPA